MRTMTIVIGDGGQIEINLPDETNVEEMLEVIRTSGHASQIRDGVGVFIPYHAIKMITILKKETNEGVETKQ